jgi:hypothetical protein
VLECKIVDVPVGASAEAGSLGNISVEMQTLYDVAMGFGNVGDPAPCNPPSTDLVQGGIGIVYYRFVTDPSSGLLTGDSRFVCIGPGEDPVPPPPPTAAEVWAAASIPQPVIHVSPYVEGLVGLDTWLWGDSHGSVTVSVSLRGWTATGTVTPSTWVFDTSDGGSYAADNPGSEDYPVGNHVFSRHGTYTITHTVDWGGGFTVSGHGLSFTVGGLSGSFDATLDYGVIEIEAVITD